MKDISIELKTNSLANSIKLAVTLLIILAAAKIYYHYDFYGVNEVWFIPLMLFIGWIYRINFSEKVQFNGSELNLTISKNIFGFSYIKLFDSNSNLILSKKTNKPIYNHTSTNNNLIFNFELSPRFKPICKITKIDSFLNTEP